MVAAPMHTRCHPDPLAWSPIHPLRCHGRSVWATGGLFPLLAALLPTTPLLVLSYVSLDTPFPEITAHGLLV